MSTLLFQLGIILLALFGAGRLAYRVRLSIVPLYIVAGIALGGYVEQTELVHFLSLLGVLFLLFYMGLDFSLSALLGQWRRVMVAGTIDLVINFPLGLGIAWLLDWTLLEALFLAGIMYMSSSAIVAKSLIDLKRVANPETETLLGIMVYEDLVVAFYLAVISGMAATGRAEGWPAAEAMAKGIGFCGAFIVAARYGRRWFDRLLAQDSPELFLLLVFGLVLLASCGAMMMGLAEAIGAFMFGLLVSETAHKERVHTVFLPFQQFFAALFFVAFGMQIEYAAFLDVWPVGAAARRLRPDGKDAGWLSRRPLAGAPDTSQPQHRLRDGGKGRVLDHPRRRRSHGRPAGNADRRPGRALRPHHVGDRTNPDEGGGDRDDVSASCRCPAHATGA